MLQAPTTQISLLVRLRDSDDNDAWQQFLDLYAPVVYRLYRRRGLQDADASDLTQEVLRAVAVGAGRLEYDPGRGTFRGWLYGVARNKLAYHLARRARHPQASGDSATLDLIHSLPAPDNEADLWELAYQRQLFTVAAEKVRAIVDETTWQVFRQTAVDDRSAREVAEELGMSVGTVYVAKSRVMARIKQHIAQIEGNDT